MFSSCTEYVLVSCSCCNKLPHIHNIKQREEFICSQFWRPDAWNQFHWVKIELLSGTPWLRRFFRRICSFFSFWWLWCFTWWSGWAGIDITAVCARSKGGDVPPRGRWTRDCRLLGTCSAHEAQEERADTGDPSHRHVSAAHSCQIHSFCSLRGHCGCFLPQQGTTTLMT